MRGELKHRPGAVKRPARVPIYSKYTNIISDLRSHAPACLRLAAAKSALGRADAPERVIRREAGSVGTIRGGMTWKESWLGDLEPARRPGVSDGYLRRRRPSSPAATAANRE